MVTVEKTLPDGYRMTELGPLPEDWRVVRLGEVVEIVKGRKPSVLLEKPTTNALPYLTADYFRSNRATYFVPREIWQTLPTCSKDDVVLIWDGSKAGQVFTGLEGVLASTMVRIDLKKDDLVAKEFLYGYLFTKFETFNSKTTGTTIPHVNKQVFISLPIPLPPLPEQRAIAHVLRAVQEAKEATERVIAAARELKKSLMRHLFTYGPVPVDAADRVPMQETEIGPLPAHWRVVKLGEVVNLRKGTIHPSDVPNARYVGLEHLVPGEIRIRQFGRANATRSAKAVFKKGDILYGKLRPYLDKAAIAEWSGVCSTDILVLRPLGVVSLFLAYLMHTPFVLNHAIATTTGVNHPRTSWKALSQASIPLPPLDEQREIARMLQAVDEKIRAEEERKQALETLFKTLLHDLMTARRRLPEAFVQSVGVRSRLAPTNAESAEPEAP